MPTKIELLKCINEQGVLPLYYCKDPEVSLQVLRVLYGAGIRAVEYTNRGEAALQNFNKMRKARDAEMRDLYLGIGTIKNGQVAQTFIDAGVDFIISPGLIAEVAAVADKNDKLWIPGCMTPSEIIRAENMGARLIKLFPGNIVGPEFMTAIKELFPDLLFMPTGGVDLNKENIERWFKAGVCAVGMGSKLISNQLLEQKAYGKMELLTRQVLEMVQSLRQVS